MNGNLFHFMTFNFTTFDSKNNSSIKIDSSVFINFNLMKTEILLKYKYHSVSIIKITTLKKNKKS